MIPTRGEGNLNKERTGYVGITNSKKYSFLGTDKHSITLETSLTSWVGIKNVQLHEDYTTM